MQLKLYNTLTRKKEVFTPLDPKNVRMYVCGPTVYDYAHIGNARPVIVFDVLFRLLRHLYGEEHVTYVRNITDVDDKIIAAAKEKGEDIGALTERTARIFHEDVAALGCLPPTHEPRATRHIPQMIAMIRALIDKGHAYAADGHVLYDVASKPDYGKLANRSLDEMIAGARVEVAPYKKNPMDFVLWKPSTPDLPGWDSPWGRGRPGWHIECSAMSETLLGESFDIHGGGIDLVFPHHENEIAQSEAAHSGAPFAKVWMHNGFLQVEGQKMSKSLGNFKTIRELQSRFPGDVLRLVMLETHYRKPIDWTDHRAVTVLRELHGWADTLTDYDTGYRSIRPSHDDVEDDILTALSDDLNTPLVLSRLRELHSAVGTKEAARRFAENLKFLGFQNLDKPGLFEYGFVAEMSESGPQIGEELYFSIVGFRAAHANGFETLEKEYLDRITRSGLNVRLDEYGTLSVTNPTGADFTAKIQAAVDARNVARKAKNFAEADRIRRELENKVVLTDKPDGTSTWELKPQTFVDEDKFYNPTVSQTGAMSADAGGKRKK